MSYNENINLFVTTDRNNADVFNAPLEKIIENIEDTRAYLNQLQTELDQLELRLVSEYTNTEQLNDILANGIKGDKGDPGEGLTYNWNGTALGVKLASEPNFIYTDLKGDPGDVSTEQLEEALTDYPTLEYLEEVKTELENEISNIPIVTKTSDLTNDSGFITASDIPEIDLSPYALKTEIPTSLPASDVYDWAKSSTKPTYTASEVGALASNGTAVNASKVANALTLQIGGTTKKTFNGSSAQTFNIPNASTSAAGVMTTAMVTKLNGIATGATKNTIDTAMSSTSTNAVQNKVIYAYIQEQLKKAGDYMGKTMVNISTSSVVNTAGYTYTNAKGGLADLVLEAGYGYDSFTLIVDGVTIVSNRPPSDILKQIDKDDRCIYFELKIPFTSTFTVKYDTDDDTHLQGFIYVNE